MSRKLTDEVIRQVGDLRAEGLTKRQIQERLGLSAGTCARAFAALKPAIPPVQPSPVEPPSEAEASPVRTLDDLAAYMGEHVAKLRLEAEKAEAAGLHERAARAQSNMTKAATLLGRLLKNDEQPKGRYVTDEQIAQAAAECRDRLRTMIERERAR